MKRNVGTIDRIIRYIAGLSIILVGLLALGGLDGNTTGIIVSAVGLVPILTGTLSFCPLYLPIKMNTTGNAGSTEK